PCCASTRPGPRSRSRSTAPARTRRSRSRSERTPDRGAPEIAVDDHRPGGPSRRQLDRRLAAGCRRTAGGAGGADPEPHPWRLLGDAAAEARPDAPAASGFDVQREYYVNDRGRQIRLLGESIQARMLDRPVPEGGYGGDYVAEIATEATARAISPEPVTLSEFGVEWVHRRIQEDLARLDVRHDQLFLESSLYAGWDTETMAKLTSLGRIVQYDGA